MTPFKLLLNTAIRWFKRNSIKIDACKTKEIIICFSKSLPVIPKITVDGDEIERVSSFTLRGIELNANLN